MEGAYIILEVGFNSPSYSQKYQIWSIWEEENIKRKERMGEMILKSKVCTRISQIGKKVGVIDRSATHRDFN